MKEKLLSRKLWITILSCIISITVIFSDVGGNVGTIMGIIGIIASSISYLLSEGSIDVARAQVTKEELQTLIEKLQNKEGVK